MFNTTLSMIRLHPVYVYAKAKPVPSLSNGEGLDGSTRSSSEHSVKLIEPHAWFWLTIFWSGGKYIVSLKLFKKKPFRYHVNYIAK